MNNTIVEYINGMEVVKVFNRDGDSYRCFEQDVRGYRDFTLAWYKVCWPWMALYNSILPCMALSFLAAMPQVSCKIHALEQLMSTLLVIAHRLHTIRDADQILVIRDGRIAQRGTHDLLMEEGGPYRDLVSAREQSQGWNRRQA